MQSDATTVGAYLAELPDDSTWPSRSSARPSPVSVDEFLTMYERSRSRP